MIILLDTCEFLWFISGNPKLPPKTKASAQDPDNVVFLSVVSLWEIIVKQNLGKLPLPKNASQYVTEQRKLHQIFSLDLSEPAVQMLESLPPIHRDPFDRMLICQAMAHEMRFATSDSTIAQYNVSLL
jgi:PIN domain nuclease of toxin-antitoxin system